MAGVQKTKTPEGNGPIRYIVTVHGIGQQRKNETVLEPIYRFAKARRGGADIPNPLTLGQLTGLSENEKRPWIAFEGIPTQPPDPASSAGLKLRKQLFFGRPEDSNESGNNLRFVDLHWADVLDDRFDEIGIPLKTWAPALLKRLDVQSAPSWAVHVLTNMKQALLPIQIMLKSRLPVLSEMIFDRFLGDVQLYGECATIRGEAVRRFHDVMAKLHAAHAADEKETKSNREARYTIIAHSLGSIMSLDALLYAHAKQSEREQTDSHQTHRFQRGYAKEFARPAPGIAGTTQNTGTGGEEKAADQSAPDIEWVKNVEAFVTLGSPIDKFIVMWPLNYEYLLDDQWMSEDMKKFRSENKIKHFNYCDEQDPVGHELDQAYRRKAVKTVFGEPAEDRVFNRYVLPGLAHLQYWTDDELFRRILDCAVDQVEPTHAHRLDWFKSSVYLGLLLCCYFLFPTIGWLSCTFAASWWWFAASFRTSIVAFAALVALALLTWKFMKVLINWRRLMIVKRHGQGANIDKDYWGRRLLGWGVRATIYLFPPLWFALLYGVLKTPFQLDVKIKPLLDLYEWSSLEPSLRDVNAFVIIALSTALVISLIVCFEYRMAVRRLTPPP